jgi:hypothetical protein
MMYIGYSIMALGALLGFGFILYGLYSMWEDR